VRQMERRLRVGLITRLHQLSFSFLDEKKSGQLETKILRDVEQIQTMSFHILQFAPMALLNISVAIIYTSWHQPLMLIFFVLQVPISLLIVRFFRRNMRKRNEAFRREMENMNADVAESIDMIPVTRAHGVEQRTEQGLHQRFYSVEQQGIRLDKFNALFGAFSWVTFQLSMVNAIVVSAFLAYHGYISVGDVVLYQGFFNMIVFSIEGIVNSVPILAKGFESVHSLGEVMESPDFEENEGKEVIGSVHGAIKFDEIEYTYPGANERAINGVTLDVNQGETIALVGGSGSGKSTLMALLIGFRRVDQGQILLDGKSVSEIDMRSWRRFISVVPQQPLLMSGTIRDNIAYGLEGISDEQIDDAIEAASLTSMVESLSNGIDTELKEGGRSLSGGQRQRIAIARAFIRDPRVIIFDEATSALDLATEQLVQKAINRLAEGRTTFIIAHRLSTIRHADRVVVMEKGRIAEQGSIHELMEQKGVYYQLAQLQE
jgi:ATP-binding cassette, subfamily B, bacterial